MLLFCLFAGRTCSATDFDWIYHFEYVNCYTFNPKSVKKITQSGAKSGLLIELFVGPPDYISDKDTATGAVIFISNETQSAFENPETLVPNEFKTRVVINRQITDKIDYPYSDCVKDIQDKYSTEFFRMTKRLYSTYTQSACLDLCYQQMSLDSCNCSDPRYASLYGHTCLSPVEVTCLYGVYTDYLEGKHIIFLKNISEDLHFIYLTFSFISFVVWVWGLNRDG